jgi:hypothetical protein
MVFAHATRDLAFDAQQVLLQSLASTKPGRFGSSATRVP